MRVKLLTTSICRSDIHYLRNVWVHPKPANLRPRSLRRHRIGGAGVPKSRIGESYPDLHAVLWQCKFCVTGRSVLCRGGAAAAGTMWDNSTRFFE